MTLLIFAAIAGIGVGLLSGLLGVGGGTIMVPLFRLVFGMSPVGATATSLFTIIPTSLSGVTNHLKNRTCLAKVGLLAGIGGALLSPIGVLAANASPGWMVMAAAALVIIYSSYTMFRKAMKAPKPEKGFLSKRPGLEKTPKPTSFVGYDTTTVIRGIMARRYQAEPYTKE